MNRTMKKNRKERGIEGDRRKKTKKEKKGRIDAEGRVLKAREELLENPGETGRDGGSRGTRC